MGERKRSGNPPDIECKNIAMTTADSSTIAGYIGAWLMGELVKSHPPTASSLYYDKYTGNYIQQSGSAIPEAILLNAMDKIKEFSGSSFKYATDDLFNGKIDLVGWQTKIAQGIKDAHIVNLQIGKGGKAATNFSDYGKVGAMLKQEYQHLNKFAADIAAGKLSEAQIKARVEMYAESTQKAFWVGKTAAMQSAGFDIERRVMSPAEHCDDCVGYAAAGWAPIGTFPEPGVGSVCGGRCKCRKEYGNSADLNADNIISPKSEQMPKSVRAPESQAPSGSAAGQYGNLSAEGVQANLESKDENKLYDFLRYRGRNKIAISEGEAKDAIVKELAERTGIPYERVNMFIHQWANTSNDTSYASFEIQRVAARKFGVQLSEWQQKQGAIVDQFRANNPQGYLSVFEKSPGQFVGTGPFATSEDAISALIDNMYDNTQGQLKFWIKNQIEGETVTLFRGITGFSEDEMVVLRNAQKTGLPVKMKSNALESWSSNPEVAKEIFSSRGNGIVIKSEVPLSRIMGSARTGFGCLREYEFVLVGNVEGDNVVIAWAG